MGCYQLRRRTVSLRRRAGRGRTNRARYANSHALSLINVAFHLTSRLIAVQPGTTQTQLHSTLHRQEQTLSAAPSPRPTPPPSGALYKRTKSEDRASSSFGGCALRSTITFGSWLDPVDFTNRYPAASSYYLVSQSSNSLTTSTDAQGVEHTSTLCVAGYIYSTDDYVSSLTSLGPLHYHKRRLYRNRTSRLTIDSHELLEVPDSRPTDLD